jgi:hypothetical protein
MENKSETEAAVELKINDVIGALSLVVGGASSGKDGESPIQIIYGINEKIKDAGSSADFGGIDDEYGDGDEESFRDKLRRYREGSMTADEEFEFEDSFEYRELFLAVCSSMRERDTMKDLALTATPMRACQS